MNALVDDIANVLVRSLVYGWHCWSVVKRQAPLSFVLKSI